MGSIKWLPTAYDTIFKKRYKSPQEYEDFVLSMGREIIGNSVAEVFSTKLDTTRKNKILDLAAGTGIISRAIYNKGFDVIATDLDENMLNTLKHKSPHISTSIMDLNMPFDFKDATFDGVTNVWGNRYIKRLSYFDYLREVYRVLKPGGVYVMPIFWLDIIIWKINNGILQSTWTKSITKDLEKTGFTIAEIIHENNPRLPFYTRPIYIIARK